MEASELQVGTAAGGRVDGQGGRRTVMRRNHGSCTHVQPQLRPAPAVLPSARRTHARRRRRRASPASPCWQIVTEADGAPVLLGEGAYGVVFLAKLGELYCAVKVGGWMHRRAGTHQCCCSSSAVTGGRVGGVGAGARLPCAVAPCLRCHLLVDAAVGTVCCCCGGGCHVD